MTVRSYVILAVLLVAAAGAVYADLHHWLTLERLSALVATAGPLAPLVFIGTYAVATVVFLPGTPFSLLGGVLFGPVWGSVYVVIGATVGAVVAFLLARTIFRVRTLTGEGTIVRSLKRYDEKLRQKGFVTVLLLRLIPIFPFNGLNAGLGVTSVSLPAYTLGTFLGIIPGTVFLVAFGSSLSSLDPLKITLAAVSLGVFIWITTKLGARLGV